MVQDAGREGFSLLRVDGGASRNDVLMQLQADAIQVPHPKHILCMTQYLGHEASLWDFNGSESPELPLFDSPSQYEFGGRATPGRAVVIPPAYADDMQAMLRTRHNGMHPQSNMRLTVKESGYLHEPIPYLLLSIRHDWHAINERL